MRPLPDADLRAPTCTRGVTTPADRHVRIGGNSSGQRIRCHAAPHSGPSGTGCNPRTGTLEPGTQGPAVQPSNLTWPDRVEAPHARGWHRGGFRARRRTAGAGASQRPNGDRFGRCGAPEPEQRSTTRASPCPGRPRCHKHNPLHGNRDRLPPQPPIDAFHNFLHRHGEPGRVALVAAMRKLLPILNAVIRDRIP